MTRSRVPLVALVVAGLLVPTAARSQVTPDRKAGQKLKALQDWVLDFPNHQAYLDRLGARFIALRPTAHRLAAPVDYA